MALPPPSTIPLVDVEAFPSMVRYSTDQPLEFGTRPAVAPDQLSTVASPIPWISRAPLDVLPQGVEQVRVSAPRSRRTLLALLEKGSVEQFCAFSNPRASTVPPVDGRSAMAAVIFAHASGPAN